MSSKAKPGLERVRYFPRQLMTAEDMNAEQAYFIERMRRHNRLLHGWGIVCGLEVEASPTGDKPWQVRVKPGFGLSPQGDEIWVAAPVCFDLARPPALDDEGCVPCSPRPPAGTQSTHYLAIRYVDRPARPVRTSHGDCGCGESNCETSRIRDDFELTLLAELLVPYDAASVRAEDNWLSQMKEALRRGNPLFGLPPRPCAPDSAGPWIILATVNGDLANPPPRALAQCLGAEKRRALPRVQDLFGIMGP